MTILTIILVCFFSSAIGSVCGIGGGVIIKPVLDAVGLMEAGTVSFLSGCTVLSMSVVSFCRNRKNQNICRFDPVFASVLTLGSVLGGVLGKMSFQKVLDGLEHKSRVGAIQAGVLFVVTSATLLYNLNKERIVTRRVSNQSAIFGIGILLGMMSSFLGIGGGPVNLVVLFYLFSMETKEAALYSIYVIMFSQASSLLWGLIGGSIPEFSAVMLALMSGCGILGGLAGTAINQRIGSRTVEQLFSGLIGVIIIVNIYNIFRYL